MNHRHKTISPRVVVQTLFFVVVLPFLPLLISWRWDWWEAWVYAIICILGFVISRVLAARRHPDLLAERARFMQHENAKAWDRLLAPLVGLGGGLIPLVAGLDALFDWSPTFSVPVRMASLAIILGGYALGSYALSKIASSLAWYASRPTAATKWYRVVPTAGYGIPVMQGRY